MIVSVLLVVLLASAAAYQFRFAAKRRAPARAWREIVSKLERVNMQGLQLIAESYLQPDAQQLSLEPPLMWELAGGDEGLRRLTANAALMLELAVVAEQWNKVEGIIVAEMLRRDALRLRRAVRSIRFSMLWSGASVTAAFHLREAVASYCLMRGRLLGLYQNAHIALVPALEVAL